MTGNSSLGLLTFLVMSALVIVLAYVSLRYVGAWQLRQTKGRRMRVLEGVPAGRDRHLLLVAVGKEVLLLGSGPGGVSLVHKLPEAESAAMLAEPEPAAPESILPAGLEGLEASIRGSLGKMRSLLKKDDSTDSKWGPP